MAVAGTDFVFYLAASRPEDDVAAAGGALALVRIMDRTVCDGLNSGSGEKIDFASAAAGDTTQTVALAGYGVDGAWHAETLALVGVTHVQSVNTYLHLKKAVLSATCAGIVTAKGYVTNAVLFTVPIGGLGQSTMFLYATANATGGAAKLLYEKCFIKNTHATDSGVGCKFYNAVDNKTELKFALEMLANVQKTGGTESVGNRLAQPATGGNTYTFTEMLLVANGVLVGDAADGNLAAAEAQGVWVQLSLAAGVAPDKIAQMTLGISVNAS